MSSSVLEAREWFVSQASSAQPKPVDMRIKLSWLDAHVTYRSEHDFASFDASRYVTPSLGVSYDGTLERPRQAFLRELVVSRLLEVAKPAMRKALECKPPPMFAIRAAGHVYPLSVLCAPEILCDEEQFAAGHGAAELVLLPASFPYAREESKEVAALKVFAKGENQYYADVPEAHVKALPMLREALEMDPANAFFANRLAACLIKCGRRKDAISLLQNVHKQNPVICGRIFWRMAVLLFWREHYENVLVTLYSHRKQLSRLKVYPKLLAIARR